MGYISRSAKYQVPCVHAAYTMGEMRCINQLCLGCHFHPQYSHQIINSDLHTLLIVRRCVCVYVCLVAPRISIHTYNPTNTICTLVAIVYRYMFEPTRIQYVVFASRGSSSFTSTNTLYIL